MLELLSYCKETLSSLEIIRVLIGLCFVPKMSKAVISLILTQSLKYDIQTIGKKMMMQSRVFAQGLIEIIKECKEHGDTESYV